MLKKSHVIFIFIFIFIILFLVGVAVGFFVIDNSKIGFIFIIMLILFLLIMLHIIPCIGKNKDTKDSQNDNYQILNNLEKYEVKKQKESLKEKYNRLDIKTKVLLTFLYFSVLFALIPIITRIVRSNKDIDEKAIEKVTEKNIVGTNLIEYKFYYLVGTSSGKTAAISFKNDGTCTPEFSGLNNSSKTGEFMVVYDIPNNDCKYTVDKKNKTISIDWYGIVTTNYIFKDGYGKYNSSIIGQKYIMKDIIVEEGMNDYLVAVNGKWDLQDIDGAFLISFVKNEEQITNDNINKE